MKNFFAVFILIGFYGNIFAQTSQEVNEYNKVSIASPTAAALAKFVDIPVSLHTGIPQINIPLYTVEEGSLSIPITISYHASGLKTLEPASWVGAGWALNAGGVITRSVRGTPDEKGTVNEFQHTGYYSNYGYRSYVFQKGYDPNDPNNPYREDIRPDSGFRNQYERFWTGEYDSEPDLFFFNVGGYSGKFYFNDDRTPVLLPEQDIKIEVNYIYGSSESIQGFTLTTPDGNKYYFGATPSTSDTDPVEYSKVLTAQNGIGWDKVLSSWYLNKIVSTDGSSTINLNYRPVVYSYYSISTSPELSQPPVGYKWIRNYIHGVELANITSSNGQVNFIQAAQPRQDLSASNTTGVEQVNGQYQPQNAAYPLGRIDILQKDGQKLLKSYQFEYGYFDDPNGPVATNLNVSETDKKRLKLLSIREQGSSGELNPPYQFFYFTEPVPRRLTFGQDHWGFINGVTNNGNKLVGTFKNTYNSTTNTVTGADRDPHWPAMRGGTIQKITFPTGGYNIYEFEPNDTYNSSITSSNGERTFIDSRSAGFDGCNCTKETTLDINLGTYNYVFQLTNGHYGGGAELDVFDSNWAPIDHISAGNDGLQEIQRNYATGLYHLRVTKYSSYGGNGATMRVYQLAGTVVNTNAMVGGLRVKSITQSSGNGNPDMVTTYDYTDSSSGQILSTGVVFGKPTIAQVVRNQIYKEAFLPLANQPTSFPIYENGCPTSPGSGLPFLMSAASIRPMGSSQGSHIGYHKVTTRQTGNGYTVSLFNMDGDNLVNRNDIVNRSIVTSPNTCTMDIPNYPAAPDPNFFRRGQLEYEAKYSEAGTLLQDRSYQSKFEDNLLTTPAMVITTNQGILNGTGIYTWYDQKTGRKTEETIRTHSYSSGGNVETVEQLFYESPYHHQLTKKILTNSTGDVLETRYRYAPDFLISSVDGLDTRIPALAADQNSLAYDYSQNWPACDINHRCKRTTWIDYDLALSHKRMTFIDYRIANFTGPNNTYSTNLQNALLTVSPELKPLIDLRIQNNLAPVETINLKNNNVTSATFNSYDYKPASQNKIYLSKISKTDFIAPVSSFTSTQTGSDNYSLVKDSRYNEKALFDYKLGKITQIQPKDATGIVYQWDYNNQYPETEVKNAQINEVFQSGFEENDPTIWGNGIAAYDPTLRHTGKIAARVDATGANEITVMNNFSLAISLTAPKRFHYSGWVYSNGPSADLWLFMKRAGETGYYSYADVVSTAVTGKWTYIEKDFLVPADVTQLNIRMDNNGTANGGNKVWFDDIRIYPADAQMTTYTYDPLVGMTSMTDTKGMTMYYEYDGFQRLLNIRDRDGNIIKHTEYHYQQ
jgi:YD repeat-containing protein